MSETIHDLVEPVRHMPFEPNPASDWARHMVRITQVLDHQVRSLRKLQVVQSLKDGRRDGAYVGIRSDIRKYKVGDRLDAPLDATTELAEPIGYPYGRGVS
ncbi:hypothetical protein ACWEOO_26100 [Kribbella sp. NPDC004138]